MLLSRVADALYWVSRYLERAEHTARLIDVAVDTRLGRSPTGGDDLVELFGRLVLPVGLETSSTSLVDVALFETAHPSSAAACVIAARENARQVRDEISSEMWEHINALFLLVRTMRSDGSRAKPSNYITRSIVEGVHLFTGATDATMGHGEAWQYLQAGRFVERAMGTAVLLSACFHEGPSPAALRPLDQADWVGALRTCAALEGFCHRYTADVRPERVAEFLLLNAECPRSIRFAATRVEEALKALARYSGRASGARADRLAGRLRASLDYAHIDEVLSEGPRTYLAGVTGQCRQIHAALYDAYITYPIESALPA